MALGDSAHGAAWLADAEAIVQSASIKPNAQALENLALAYATMGDDAAAIRAAESVIRFPPFQAGLFSRLALAATTRRAAASEYARRALIICRIPDWDTNPGCYDAAADVATACALAGDHSIVGDAIAYLEELAPEREFRSDFAQHAAALAVARTALGWPNSSKLCRQAFVLLEEKKQQSPDSCVYDLDRLARRLSIYRLDRAATLLRI